ncbi:MAG: hypothetical protein K0Q61_136 [Rhodococcus erythropolis]|nr:hypothetical protein [Rhodococcus erythropolis]
MRRAGSILAGRIPRHRHRRTLDRYAHLRRTPEDHETCSVRSVLRPRRAEHFTCQFRQRRTTLDQRFLEHWGSLQTWRLKGLLNTCRLHSRQNFNCAARRHRRRTERECGEIPLFSRRPPLRVSEQKSTFCIRRNSRHHPRRPSVMAEQTPRGITVFERRRSQLHTTHKPANNRKRQHDPPPRAIVGVDTETAHDDTGDHRQVTVPSRQSLGTNVENSRPRLHWRLGSTRRPLQA